ncbi:MAG TPA: phosphate ABC transporter substrate-binding protein [Ktedonobacteraceae bacterium]|nr:phosphate ABC transporter substrate-binding protein [Ktedonobacteraceae bacterium]
MLKQCRYMLLVGIAVAITLFISACGSTTSGSTGGTTSTSAPGTLGTPGQYNCISGSLVASGSTALAPLVQAVAQKYQGKCASAHITVNLGGSKTGLSQAEAGSVGVGNSDIFASSSQSDLVDHQVAVVIFGVIVNAKVGVTNLTTAQIQGIYAGTYTNWKQVGGPDMKIVVVSRPASSGTRATFQQYVLGGPEKVAGPTSLTTDSTGTVVTNVAQTAGAIGYAATGPAKGNSGVSLISLDGNAPTSALSENNTYKFWNIEHMYTKGQPSQLAQALIDYMASSDAATVAATQDFIPLDQMQSSAVQTHQPK